MGGCGRGGTELIEVRSAKWSDGVEGSKIVVGERVESTGVMRRSSVLPSL